MTQWNLKRGDRVKFAGPCRRPCEAGIGKVKAIRMTRETYTLPGLCGGTMKQMVTVRWEKSRKTVEYIRDLVKPTRAAK